MITQFEGGPGLLNVTLLKTGYTLSGTSVLFTGSQNGTNLALGFSARTRDTTQYLSLMGGTSVLLTTPGIRGFSFYTGTRDDYNGMKFNFSDGTTETTPTKLHDFVPRTSGGQRVTGRDRDGHLHFGFSKSLLSVEVFSSGNTFEISDFTASTVVPEPATWALMITGFGAAGAMLRRRRAVTA